MRKSISPVPVCDLVALCSKARVFAIGASPAALHPPRHPKAAAQEATPTRNIAGTNPLR